MKCARCLASNDDASLFCETCGGILGSGEELECENHSGTIALGICVVCSKPVCGDCSVTRDGKMYCDDVDHSRLGTDFTRLGTAANEPEGDIIVKNLSLNGIPGKKFPRLFSFANISRIPVFVPAGSVAEAKRLLREMDLEEFLTY